LLAYDETQGALEPAGRCQIDLGGMFRECDEVLVDA
jgi:hypothetical protein